MKRLILLAVVMTIPAYSPAFDTTFFQKAFSWMCLPQLTKEAKNELLSLRSMSSNQKEVQVIEIVVKALVLIFGAKLSTIVIHELGHAITAKILWNCPINIVFGTQDMLEIHNTKEVSPPLFKIFGVSIYKGNPLKGLTIANPPQGTYPLSRFLFHLAGPVAGFSGLYFFYHYLSRFGLAGFLSATILTENLIPDLFNLLIPNGRNDGYKIAKNAFNISDDTLDKMKIWHGRLQSMRYVITICSVTNAYLQISTALSKAI